MLEVKRLDRAAASAVYKFLLERHPAPLEALKTISFRDFYLSSKNGSVIAAVADRARIKQAVFTEFESAKTACARLTYGEYGSWTPELLNELCTACTEHAPALEEYAFLLTAAELPAFEAGFQRSRLRTYQAEERLINLPAGLRPTDKLTWEKYLLKNVPSVNMVVKAVKVRYP